jgi:hypothetical protein
MPTKLPGSEPESGRDFRSSPDQPPRGPSNAGPLAETQARTVGFIARHPVLFKLLEWLGWNNPGGSMNP